MPDEGSVSLNVLSRKEYEILKAIGNRIVPRIRHLPELDLAQRVDAVLANVQQQMKKEFKLLLILFEYGAPVFGPAWKSFTRMSEMEQDRYLAGWERSRLSFKRMGFQALKRSLLAAYYGSELAWEQIAYRGPWLVRGYPHDYVGTGIQVPARDRR